MKKEEPKQETPEQHLELINNNIEEFDKAIESFIQRKSKQETLEEACERYYEEKIDQSNIPREHYEIEIKDLMIGFVYKWQQQQNNNLYSEEDMQLAHKVGAMFAYGRKEATKTDRESNFNQWFEQFKNK